MRLRTAPIEINVESPFVQDCLERKPVVESLTNLVLAVTPPLVLCIDSPWGTGKSTFLRLWEAHSKSKNIHALYFNAWSTDFATDPLIPFIGEIAELIAKKLPKKATKHLDSAKRIASAIARRALPAAGKIATAGLLDLEQFNEEVLSEVAEDSIKDLADAYIAERDLIKKFHDEISKLVAHMPADSGTPRLLLLVDELDRCRPTYALALLERIKHLFNVDNIVFVLALDKRQLRSSIEAVYGTRIDSEDYLRRFIDLEYRLPAPKPDAYASYLYQKFELDAWFKQRANSEFRYDAEHLFKTFCGLSRVFNLSLRTQEQCFSRIKLAMLATADNFYFFPNLVAALVVLRTTCPDEYRRFSSPDGSAAELLAAIRDAPGGPDFLEDHIGTVLECCLVSANRGRKADPLWEELEKLAENETTEAAVKERAKKIVEMRRFMQSRDRSPDLTYVLSKIELGYQFS